MAPATSFDGYPIPVDRSKDAVYEFDKDQNPALRGLPVVVASTLVSHSHLLQKFIWSNAGFGSLKDRTEFASENSRFRPTVVPLAESSAPSPSLDIDDELFSRQPADCAGRYYSVLDYHELYKSGKTTPLRVVEALLPIINREHKPRSEYATAWLDIHEDEVLTAAKASTLRWSKGKYLGILDGVPFGVKSDVLIKGFVTSLGMKVDKSIPFHNTPSDVNEWPVQKLLEAGAILMGQNNQHELGMDITGCNPSTGTPTNWMNKAYFPGGSSSGAGSSLSAGLVPITVGTDAGGSMRIPPCLAGAYGFKTSYNRTCTRHTSSVVVGPMASNVADLTIAYRVMAQPNLYDPIQGRFAPSTVPDPSSKKYIGICRPWIDISNPRIIEIFDQTIEYYRATLGYEIVDIDIPYLREGELAHAIVCLTDAAASMRDLIPSSRNFLAPLSYPNKILMGTGSHTSAVDYLRYNQVREVLMQHFAFLFRKYPGLIIASPTMPEAGWQIHPGDQRYGVTDGNNTIRRMKYCWLANFIGCPAITAPVGYVDPEAGEGRLPIGMMAMGEWGAEEQLLSWAGESEKYLHDVYPGGRVKPQGWVDVLSLASGQR